MGDSFAEIIAVKVRPAATDPCPGSLVTGPCGQTGLPESTMKRVGQWLGLLFCQHRNSSLIDAFWPRLVRMLRNRPTVSLFPLGPLITPLLSSPSAVGLIVTSSV